MFEGLSFEDLTSYTQVARIDGKPFDLFGTSYKTHYVYATDQLDSYTFVYRGVNESGTYSYGEIAYDEVYIV